MTTKKLAKTPERKGVCIVQRPYFILHIYYAHFIHLKRKQQNEHKQFQHKLTGRH